MEPRDLIVLTPAKTADVSIAIAACRAGALGVLDLEFPPNPAAVSAELVRLAHFGDGPFGVLIHAADANDLLPLLLSGLVKPARVIVTGDHADLPRYVRELRAAGIDMFVEAVSLAEAARAAELGVAGLILKGHEAGGRVGADTSFVLVQKWKRHADKARLD